MTRLMIVVEGQTEEIFAKHVLRPHSRIMVCMPQRPSWGNRQRTSAVIRTEAGDTSKTGEKT